jgi:hypothetical protein
MAVRHIGKSRSILAVAVPLTVLAMMAPGAGSAAEGEGLWPVQSLKGAKYVDLTHTITPKIPVWSGFAASTFAPARAGSDIEGYAKTGEVYTYDKHGFEATEYALKTDQIRRPIGRPNIRRSTSCLRLTPSGRLPSYRSSSN